MLLVELLEGKPGLGDYILQIVGCTGHQALGLLGHVHEEALQERLFLRHIRVVGYAALGDLRI